MKVYLSPLSQTNNVGVGSYGTEADRMQQLSDKVKAKLIAKGHTVYGNDNSLSLNERIAASNASGATLHVALHSNAASGNARGPEAFYKAGSNTGKRLANCILYEIADISGCAASRGLKSDYLLETNNVTCTCALIEIAFHDNAEDVAWILSHMDDIAEAIATGICEY